MQKGRHMPNPTRPALGWALALGTLIGPGCAGPLEVVEAPDCAEEPAISEGLGYWAIGRVGPAVNWSGCDKSGADLRGVNLSGADLSFVDLRGANLQGADLGGALATGARLGEADLRGANVVSLHLTDADLRGANLTGADLTGVKTSGVEFSGATWVDGTTTCAEDSIGTCRR